MNTRQLFIAFVLVAALLAGCGTAETPAPATTEGTPAAGLVGATDTAELAQAEAALQGLIDQAVDRQGIPGMVMAVRLADGAVIWNTSGKTAPDGTERWQANTRSAIASITKTFTAVVVMQLVEEGKLTLDDTVDAWLPEQPNGDRITVRMLLSHTSGLANYDFGTDIEKWTRAWTPEELIGEANQAGPVGQPGSRLAHYANTNYIMLGLIIEKATGRTWSDEITSRITGPLGLNDTALVPTGQWNAEVVPGYIPTPDGYQSTVDVPWYAHSSTAWAAGGLVSTVADLMNFAAALFDGELVSRETLAVMAQPVGYGGGRAWGLGGGVIEAAGHRVFGMGGDTTGYHAFFGGALDGKLAVAALVNSENGDAISPGLEALKYFGEQPSGE
jgi:D-alanyl-D-alanine carboxypeptidase